MKTATPFFRNVVLGALALFITALAAEAERLPVRIFGLADGIPSNNLNCIVRDSHGFLWFCTEEGLSRFDGYTFVNYAADEGLPDRSTNDLLETADGEYWIATVKGLCRFDPRGVRPSPNQKPHKRMSFFELFAPTGPEGASQIVGIVPSSDGNIWCSTADGLYKFDRKQRNFKQVVPKPPGDWFNTMLPDPDGSLWLGATQVAHLLANGKVDWYGSREGFAPNILRVSDILRDRAGRLWVATWSGLYRLTAHPGIGQNCVERFYNERDGLPNHFVFSLLQTQNGRLLIGLERGGIFEFLEGDSNRPDRFRSFAGKQGLETTEIKQPAVDMMAEDASGNIWLSRATRVTPNGFTSFGTPDGLKTGDVGSIFENHDGQIVVLTCDPRCRYIDTFDGERFHTVEPRLPAAMKDVTWGFGQIHFQDHTGAWWVAASHGLCRYPHISDLARGTPDLVLTRKNGFQGDEVFRLFEDSKQDLWISVLGGNAPTRWQRATGKVETFRLDQSGQPLDLPTVFAQDRTGDIWVGFFKPGLARFHQGRFQLFTSTDGMPHSTVRALFIDTAGRLWIGTSRAGLVRVDNPSAMTPRFQVLTAADGLVSNEVKSITEDGDGKLYLGTGRGIDRLDPRTGQIRHYTALEGLGFSATPRVAYRDRRGMLWFGGSGLLRFDPSETADVSASPPIRIVGIAVRGQARRISELGEQSVDLPTLGAAENDIRIEFATLNFTPGRTIQSQYKLDGVDADWGRLADDRGVSYARLAPSKYRFVVRAVTSDGLVSAIPSSVSFTIEPPFWQRWWFLALTLLLVSTMAITGHRYRVTQLVKTEQLRAGIATDLHDDIGSSLSQISILTELVHRNLTSDASQADSHLQRIGTLSREMIDSMAEIVWAMNIQHDSLGDLASHMRRFANDLLAAKGVVFSLTTNEKDMELNISSVIRRQIFLIFKESIHNVAKHSECHRVRADLKSESQQLQLSVVDDGRGFDQLGVSRGKRNGQHG